MAVNGQGSNPHYSSQAMKGKGEENSPVHNISHPVSHNGQVNNIDTNVCVSNANHVDNFGGDMSPAFKVSQSVSHNENVNSFQGDKSPVLRKVSASVNHNGYTHSFDSEKAPLTHRVCSSNRQTNSFDSEKSPTHRVSNSNRQARSFDDGMKTTSKHSGVVHLQKRSQSARRQKENGKSAPDSRDSFSARPPCPAQSTADVEDSVDYRQDSDLTVMGRTHKSREPVTSVRHNPDPECSLSRTHKPGVGSVQHSQDLECFNGRGYKPRDCAIAWDTANTRPASHSPHKTSVRGLFSQDPRQRVTSRNTTRNTSPTHQKRVSEIQPQNLHRHDLPELNHQHTKHSTFPAFVGRGEEEQEDDDDDENTSSSPSPPPSPSNSSRTWEDFDEHVRAINDQTDQISKQNSPFFQASAAFQETMVDLFGYPDYSHPPPAHPVSQVAARTIHVAGAVNKFLALRKRCVGTGNRRTAAPRKKDDQLTVDNAKRGWRVLRQYVQDHFFGKRTSQAALSWTMLRHTMKSMGCDQEKTRRDLYQRYGIIPSVDEDGNKVLVNSMLSEKARKISLTTHSRRSSSPSSSISSRRNTVAFSQRPPDGLNSSSAVWTSNVRSNSQQSRRLSSSFSLPSSSSSSSTRWCEDSGRSRRPGKSGVVRGGGGGGGKGWGGGSGNVRPHSSCGARARMNNGGGESGSACGALLPLRKISEPTFRSSRSFDC